VDDLLEGMTRLMATPDSITGPINVGNPHEFTMLELATKVIDLTGSSSKLVFRELPSDDPRQRQPDISKAAQLLDNWYPKVQLEEGLKKTIQYFEEELSR
jgi:UDP-glucuronate decarboxylase